MSADITWLIGGCLAGLCLHYYASEHDDDQLVYRYSLCVVALVQQNVYLCRRTGRTQ